MVFAVKSHFLVKIHEFKWNSMIFSKKQYFGGNTAFHLKMWFGAEMKQNTYHIPLVLQYFLQGTLEINFSTANKKDHGISDFLMGFIFLSWKSQKFMEI